MAKVYISVLTWICLEGRHEKSYKPSADANYGIWNIRKLIVNYFLKSQSILTKYPFILFFKVYFHQTSNSELIFPLSAADESNINWVRPNISAIQKKFRWQCPRVLAFSHVEGLDNNLSLCKLLQISNTKYRPPLGYCYGYPSIISTVVTEQNDTLKDFDSSVVYNWINKRLHVQYIVIGKVEPQYIQNKIHCNFVT